MNKDLAKQKPQPREERKDAEEGKRRVPERDKPGVHGPALTERK